MTGVDEIQSNTTYTNEFSKPINKDNNEKLNKQVKRDNLNINNKPKNTKQYIYSDPKKANNNVKETLDPIKRPINIDSSNNIFYINHNGENESIKIEPGKYDLIELSKAIQTKVNETFGIGKVTVELTGSGSDRVIRAEDKTIFDFLDNKNQ